MVQDNDFDIFHWANQADAKKHDLAMDVFLFNKHCTPHRVSVSSFADDQLRNLLLFDYINSVQRGGARGMAIRNWLTQEPNEDSLMFIDLENVGRAQTLVYLADAEHDKIEQFNPDVHDMKKMIGVVAKFTDLNNPVDKFYTIKAISRAQILKKGAAWQFTDETLSQLEPNAAFNIPADNHVLVAGDKAFAFNQSKFMTLFKYDPGMANIVRKRCRYLTDEYKLKLPEGLTLEYIADRSKTLARAIAEIDTSAHALPSKDDIEQLIEEVGLALMMDDTEDGFIIMDERDARMFVNILSDNYVDGSLSGDRYLATKKKRIDNDVQLNMNI